MHFANQVALVLFLVMLIAVATGCSRPPLPKTSASAGASSFPAEKAAQPEKTPGRWLDQVNADANRTAGDATLTAKVKTALASDAGLKTLKIDVDANSGVVTLKGRVESDDAKKRIHEIAQAVPGVTWVQNQISVAPKPG